MTALPKSLPESRVSGEKEVATTTRYGMRCPTCRSTMAEYRTDEQWSHGKQYILRWARCHPCGTVELAGWEVTDLIVERRPRSG